jgi:hypothetical protein
VTEHQPDIELHIEELVLHGVDPADRHRIGDAVERELARLLVERPIAARTDLEHIDAGTRRLPAQAKAPAIGAQVARAVHGGLTK